MSKKLFLLDGMALVYRAHFALVGRPILTSKGVNTSAIYVFTNTLLEIVRNQQPTHLAVAFDTDAPTPRHAAYPEYKATRQAMPEELSQALPHVNRLLNAFCIPILTCDGYEADDIIGTLVRRAEKEGFQSYMVTPDKDFGQLVDANTFLYKPGRMGSEVELMGVAEIRARWGIEKPEQVIDILALMGDSSDNIPGVPGVGEKTAMKLVGQFGSVESLLARTSELSGRVKENLEKHREDALLSKRLATILCDAPCPLDLELLKVQPPHEEELKALFVEFEFNTIGKRVFGESFSVSRGGKEPAPAASKGSGQPAAQQGELTLGNQPAATPAAPLAQSPAATSLKTIADISHDYRGVGTAAERVDLAKKLSAATTFSFHLHTSGPNPKEARILGLAFSAAPHTGFYVPLPSTVSEAAKVLEEFRPVLESEHIEKVGHNLKFDLTVLRWHGINVGGKLFDTMVAHSLIEPDLRHGLHFLSETFLAYSPIPVGTRSPQRARKAPKPADASNESAASLPMAAPDADESAESPQGSIELAADESTQLDLDVLPPAKAAEVSSETADLALQLRSALEPLLKEKGQQRVFYEVESPLISVLVDMEYEGIRVDAGALADFSAHLGAEIDNQEKTICRMAGSTFNLNSTRQLGQVLFEVLKICEAPKKTKTGLYATDEQTLVALAPEHEIVRRLLDYRAASKLKSTYADALPAAIWAKTGRIHTTYNQVVTSTGRLNSQDPNLQNIPIRTERGQEVRKAFVPRGPDYRLLSADYSQIELRIIAALSRESGLLEAFRTGADVHTATAARVYGVMPGLVTAEMRRKAKMVNYGIAYGISSFGLAQRLGIPRSEAAEIIKQYFVQFPGIRRYMDDTIAFARANQYVETVTGRRRYIRDIRSANHTLRSAAERNAINAPIQGTAADMIKIAMVNIHAELSRRALKSRMLLQVHDELVFDLFNTEEAELRALVKDKMSTALPLEVPIEVELGVGDNWLEAH